MSDITPEALKKLGFEVIEKSRTGIVYEMRLQGRFAELGAWMITKDFHISIRNYDGLEMTLLEIKTMEQVAFLMAALWPEKYIEKRNVLGMTQAETEEERARGYWESPLMGALGRGEIRLTEGFELVRETKQVDSVID